jgi:hypothetical protein
MLHPVRRTQSIHNTRSPVIVYGQQKGSDCVRLRMPVSQTRYVTMGCSGPIPRWFAKRATLTTGIPI